jgi:hypothetical protein
MTLRGIIGLFPDASLPYGLEEGGAVMTCNVGGVERVIRVGVGIFLLSLGMFVELPIWSVFLSYVVGAVALTTGVIGYCPAWQSLGINTCPTKPASRP